MAYEAAGDNNIFPMFYVVIISGFYLILQASFGVFIPSLMEGVGRLKDFRSLFER